jgi:zinc protease
MNGRSLGTALLVLIVGLGAGAEAQPRWPNSNPPRPLAPRDAKFPPYHVQTLPNGLQVVAVLHHEQPVISMRLLIRAGGALDPRGKNGLAELAASVLTQGAAGRSANQLQETVDFMGAIMSAGAGTDLSSVSLIVMKDSFETGLEILSDVARRPNFAAEEIERQRQQMLSSLQVSFESPEFIADSVFRRLVYGFHPYGMPQNGTPDTLPGITRDDLVAYHRRNFVPNNAILAIVGDITETEAFDGVRKVFGDWERRDVTPPAFTPPPDPTRRIVVINKPDAVQTEVRVGHLGVRRTHADYMPLNLVTRILGGEGANRLHQVLRTERGLTYGASADFDTLKEAGAFEASTNTRSEATGEVLRLMVDEFWRLQRERVGERELSDAKAYLTGSFPLTIETPDAIATQVLNVLFFGLPVEQLQSFRQRVNAVSVDDVERVARFFLRPDRLSIVLVGNAAAFEKQLRSLGFDKYEVVEMGNLDLTTPDFKKPGRIGALELRPWNVLRSPFSVLRSSGGVRRSAFDVRRAGFDVRRSSLRTSNGPGRTPNLFERTTNAERRTSNRGQAIAAADGASALALVDKAIAAKGGLDTLRAIKSITAVTASSMEGPKGRVELKTTTYLEYPNRVRVETQIAGATIVQTYDGQRAWVKDPSGTHEVPERMIRDLESTFKRDVVAALLAAHDQKLRSRLLPDVKDEAGRLHHALELSGDGLAPTVMYIDRDTSHVAKLAYIVNGPGKPLVEEIFSDHRVVDGVGIAYLASVRQAGKPMIERRVLDIKINAPLNPALFQRPAA